MSVCAFESTYVPIWVDNSYVDDSTWELYVCTHIGTCGYICIFVCHACDQRGGPCKKKKSAVTCFPTGHSLQFASGFHCGEMSLFFPFVFFMALPSVVINDPFQQLHQYLLPWETVQGQSKLLFWQQSELVNYQLKNCSRTSWNLLGHGWKRELII